MLALLQGCGDVIKPEDFGKLLPKSQSTQANSDSNPGEQAERLMKLASDMEARGGKEEQATALTLYQQAVSASNEDPGVLVRLAEAYDKAGQTNNALKTYRSAIGKNPAFGPAYMGLGALYVKMGHTERGIKQLEKAATLLNNGVAYNRLGIAYTQTGKVKEARAAFETAIKLQPGDIDIATNLALAKALDGDYDGAVALMQEVNESSRAQERHRHNLVLVLALSGRPDEARRAGQDAMQPKELNELISRAAKMRTLSDPKERAKSLGTAAPAVQ